MNVPVKVPSFVNELDIVGTVGDTAQQTPLDSKLPPPLLVTFPPPLAELGVIELTLLVVTVGKVMLLNGI